MNNDLPQDQPAEDMPTQNTFANAKRAELTAMAELLEHYGVFNRLRSKLWHANLDSDQRAIAEYEPKLKEAESAYRNARRAAGQAIYDARKATWGLRWAEEELLPMPNIVLSERLPHATHGTFDRSELTGLAVDEQPNFIADLDVHLNWVNVERPSNFISVAKAYTFFPIGSAASDPGTNATLEFAADVDRFVAEDGRAIPPESKSSDLE